MVSLPELTSFNPYTQLLFAIRTSWGLRNVTYRWRENDGIHDEGCGGAGGGFALYGFTCFEQDALHGAGDREQSASGSRGVEFPHQRARPAAGYEADRPCRSDRLGDRQSLLP